MTGNWQVTLQDDFEGDTLDASRWITHMRVADSSFRVWGGRQEYMADENVRLEDGDCVLSAENVETGGQPYTSGAVNSAGLFEQEYGFFETRLRLPLGNGFWGVWALRSLAGWPPAIGGVEVLGGQPARALFSYWWQGETEAQREYYEVTNDYTNGFHIYGIDWQPTYVAYYVDGALVKRLDDPDGRLSGPLYPSVNLSISAADSGDPVPDATTPWPGELRIDWIRVYTKLP
jgi:beta-glucanase (GH16 family)